jgi:putative aldouronate transport system permease protein
MMFKQLKTELPLHLMILPGVILVFIFCYIPMYGIRIAFEQYNPAKGLFGNQTWIGFSNFRYLFMSSNFIRVLRNTIVIASLKVVAGILVPVVASILLNEVRNRKFSRFAQTSIYLPYFLSWVILSGIFVEILSPERGLINVILGLAGIKPIYFLGNKTMFPVIMVATDTWKNYGFNTIIYLAALTCIDPCLYESAELDGANRWNKIVHVSLPGMLSIIALVSTLSLGSILNAGFDQIFNMYSSIVYETGDIIDTYVYRLGLVQMQYGMATAVGLFKSLVSFVLISVSYLLAYRYANYRVF